MLILNYCFVLDLGNSINMQNMGSLYQICYKSLEDHEPGYPNFSIKKICYLPMSYFTSNQCHFPEALRVLGMWLIFRADRAKNQWQQRTWSVPMSEYKRVLSHGDAGLEERSATQMTYAFCLRKLCNMTLICSQLVFFSVSLHTCFK